MEQYLYNKNFTKCYIDNNPNEYYLIDIDENNNTIIYLKNTTYSLYLKKIFNLDINEQPDEAFLIINNYKYYLKLIEKKYLDKKSNKTSLKTGSMNKELYNQELNNNNDNHKFNIELAYCINNYIDSKLNSDDLEYKNIKKILSQLNINIFNGENENYYDTIYKWLLL